MEQPSEGLPRVVGSEFENNFFTEKCSGSEAGSYLRRIDFVYHSTLGLRVIKKRGGCLICESEVDQEPPPVPKHRILPQYGLGFRIHGLGFQTRCSAQGSDRRSCL